MKTLALLALLAGCDSTGDSPATGADCDLIIFLCDLPEAPYCIPADWNPCPPGLFAFVQWALPDGGLVDLPEGAEAPPGALRYVEHCAYSQIQPANGEGWRNVYHPSGGVARVEYSDPLRAWAWECPDVEGARAETFQRYYPGAAVQCFADDAAPVDCATGARL